MPLSRNRSGLIQLSTVATVANTKTLPAPAPDARAMHTTQHRQNPSPPGLAPRPRRVYDTPTAYRRTPPEEAFFMHNYTTACNADGIWSLSVLSIDEHETIQISTHPTETEALEAMIDAIVEEKRVVQSNLDTTRARQDSTTRQLDNLRDLIESLPWHEINTGDFHPMQGCGDVATFREAAIDLGCSERINLGADCPYSVTAEVTLRVSFTVIATGEENAHDLAELALESCEYKGGHLLDDFCIDDTSSEVEGVEAC